MKSQDHVVKMKCTETGKVHYVTRKNKKQNPDKLELKKYNPVLRKRTLYREEKK